MRTHPNTVYPFTLDEFLVEWRKWPVLGGLNRRQRKQVIENTGYCPDNPFFRIDEPLYYSIQHSIDYAYYQFGLRCMICGEWHKPKDDDYECLWSLSYEVLGLAPEQKVHKRRSCLVMDSGPFCMRHHTAWTTHLAVKGLAGKGYGDEEELQLALTEFLGIYIVDGARRICLTNGRRPPRQISRKPSHCT